MSTHPAISNSQLPPWDESGSSGFPLRRLTLMSVVAGSLGAFVGVVAYFLFRLIGLITNLAFYGHWSFTEAVPSTEHLGLWVILVPAIGGLIIGLIAHFGSPKIRGHGIDAVIEAVLYRRSKVDPEIAVLKPAASAVVIGTGGPFGVEGPIIQTGGAVGSIIGQALHLTASERKTLLAAGAAAGLAATFSVPIASVILAIELILFEYKPRSFIPLVVATTLAPEQQSKLVRSIFSPVRRCSRSSSGTAGSDAASPGMFRPWREATAPPVSISVSTSPSASRTPVTRIRTAPSAR